MGGNKMTSFSVEGLQSPVEVAVAWQAVEQYRRSSPNKPQENLDSTARHLDGATTILAQRILKGLTWGPLGPRYNAILGAWFEAAPGQAVRIDELAKTLHATSHELRANLSKLSARMKRIATPEEAASLRTPFLLLADIEYDEKNSSRHRLTPAGREAVRQYLKR
jgi:hypothetical protein